LQDLLHSCMVDVIGFCCNLQPCMLHVASCIVVVIGVLGSSCCRVAGSCHVDAVASMACKDESVHGGSTVVVSS